MKNTYLLLLLLLFVVVESKAQDRDRDRDAYYIYKNNDTITQVDGIDYLKRLFKIDTNQDSIKNKKVNFSFFPY